MSLALLADLSPQMDRIVSLYHAMPPLIQTAVNCGLLAAFALIAMCFLRSKRFKILLFAVALLLSVPALNAVLAYHPELVDARYRTYKDFYNAIHPGMTREDVLFTEEKFYPANSERLIPKTICDSAILVSFTMNPEYAKEPDHETILLTLKDGKVVAKEYSED